MKRAGSPAQRQSGRSSGVEHNLAKVGVEGSNPFARSRLFFKIIGFFRVAGCRPIDARYARRQSTGMMKSAAQLLMERETRVRYGPVDLNMFGYTIEAGRSHLEADSFLLHTPDGFSCFYRKGEGVTIFRSATADPSDERLWLNGSVYSAVACINGLLPIHASAVAFDGRLFAFTGPSGSGKSTLIAALGQLGLPMFCDDTLVLDLSDPDRIIGLPGHKRLKLTPAAVDLTGAKPIEKVGNDVDKYYAETSGGAVESPLSLAELIFLEEGPIMTIERLSGSERFVRTQDDHYTAHLFAAARQFDRTGQFEHRARLARQIAMARFVRPLDEGRFREGVTLAAQYVCANRPT
jgi:hypothetical protein